MFQSVNMDASKRLLLCRLCGLHLQRGKFKYIFDTSTDLLQKIRDTLPIDISSDDNGSKYICMDCHGKVLSHYKFIQEVLQHNLELENMKSLHDTSKNEKADIINSFSSLHEDMIYMCPNCNVDLMILLSNNVQGCDPNFQISLAIVGHTEKFSPIRDKIIESTKNPTCLFNGKENTPNQKQTLKVFKDVNSEKIEKTVEENSHILQQRKSRNYTAYLTRTSEKENSADGIQSNTKRKNEGNSNEVLSSPTKTPKLQLVYEVDSNADTDSYDYIDPIVKIEQTSDNVNWASSESDCKTGKNDTEELQEPVQNIIKYEESDIARSWQQIVCDLCGSRYLSQSKYEFHMERHKADKMDKFVCTLCDKETSNENLLWDHYFHTHKSFQRYMCTDCGKIFTKRARLNSHHKRHNHSGVKEVNVGKNETDVNRSGQNVDTTDSQYRKISMNCHICGELITNLDRGAFNDVVTCAACDDTTLSLMVDGDEARVISPRQYHCSQCPKHFVRRERLEFHEMRHNENMKEFVCSTCGKEFSAENSLYEHYLFVHKGARPHICELCGKSFQLKARLKEHHRTHTGERPFQCDICGQRCMTSNALRLHRKIHFSNNRYPCKVCNKSFSKKQNMNEHLEKHWKRDKSVSLPQMFTCTVCSENFPTYRMLKYHMIEIHKVSNLDPRLIKQKPWYECAVCQEKFKHQMSLKAHREKVHEGKVAPMYECDTCKASYRIKQLLINHIKSKHDGEKRYKCAQCEKGFNDTKSLYNHILLHTGKKPFGCKFCNVSFRRKDSRDRHHRKHTGEQPYQCADCGQTFSTYNARSKHKKREHEEGEFECPECKEKCSSQQEVRFHLNKHLGEKLKKLQNV